jgi:hypothetical protein
VTGGWRKLSPNIIKRIRRIGHVARIGENRNVCRILMGKPEGKRSVGRPRRMWENNVKMDLREIG